jgi:hypothetical protein
VRTATSPSSTAWRWIPSIRITGPGATVAQDLEPEYVTVSKDGRTAWVALQENNAIAVLDIKAGEFTSLRGMGFKDHLLPGNGMDVSDQNPAIRIANWPVYGVHMPDAIASYESGAAPTSSPPTRATRASTTATPTCAASARSAATSRSAPTRRASMTSSPPTRLGITDSRSCATTRTWVG